MNDKTEKCYISRDEGSEIIWIWRKPDSGDWEPKKVKDCEIVMYQRKNRSLSNASYYLADNFKKKFGIIISKKTKKCVKLSLSLLDNEDYKEISNDPDRKR